MALVHQIDFRALPTQSIGAAGAYTIDDLTWYAKGTLTPPGQVLTSGIVNGSGLNLKMSSGLGLSIGTSGALAHRHFFLPLASIPNWSSGLPVLFRARFSYAAPSGNQTAFFGIIDSTLDGVNVIGAQRLASELLVGPAPSSVATQNVQVKIKGAADGALLGLAGVIDNDECVVGVYQLAARFATVGSEHLASGMPTTFDSWRALATQGTVVDLGTMANPGLIVACACSGSNSLDFFLEQIRVDSIGDLNDTTAPTVELISPPVTQLIGRKTPVVVRVTDDNELRRSYIWAEYNYGSEVVYAGDHFTPAFAGESSVSGTNPRTFTIVRTGGWLAPPTVHVEPIDAGGNTSTP